MPEPSLVRFRAGDERAWREAYDAHASFVLRSIRRLGVPEAEAEELCHDVFLVAFKKRSAFVDGKLSTWLFRIAANVVSDRHRKVRLRDSLWSLFGARGEPVEENHAGERFEAKEAERRASDVLSRMSAKKRDVFVLFELEGLSGEEVAERVGCSVATVWTRLHHARREFEQIARKRGLVT